MFPLSISPEAKNEFLASQNIGLDGLAVFDTVFANTLDALRAWTYHGLHQPTVDL
jgi:hypothetical protein